MLPPVRSPVLSFARAFGLGAAAFALAACSGDNGGGNASGVRVTPHLEDVYVGDANAPIVIEEYASLSCGHCRDFWKQDYPRLKADYIDTGKVRFTLKDFPTDRDIAVAGIALARCKGADNYYPIMDAIFTAQYDLLMAAREGAAGAKLVEIAGQHDVSPEEMRACLSDKRIMDFIEKTTREGQQRGVRGTPVVFVNNEQLDDHRYPALKAKIESILNPGAAPVESAEPATPVPTTPSTGVDLSTPPATEPPPSE